MTDFHGDEAKIFFSKPFILKILGIGPWVKQGKTAFLMVFVCFRLSEVIHIIIYPIYSMHMFAQVLFLAGNHGHHKDQVPINFD